MPITEHPYHIDEERSDIQFDVYGDQVAFMVPAGTGDTTIYDFYLIGDRDNTTPTNQNTFSALRILDEINSAIGYGNKYLRKDCEDETQYMLRLMGGAKVDGTLGLWIGDALLTYENGALHLSNCNGFWADGFISALGEGSGGGGGGGGGDFSREALFNVLKSSPNTGEYINPAFIPIDGTTLYIQNGTLKSRGTISSVGLAVPTGLTVSNSPLTANGTITIGLASGYVIPTESRLSTIESAITSLDSRVDALEDMFGIDGNGNIYVKNNRGFYSNSFVSALGSNSGSSGGGLDREQLFNILRGNPATGEYINSQFLKLGSGLSIDENGNVKVDSAGSVAWSSITGKPTTISGYGITDAYTKTESDAKYVTVAFFNQLFEAQDANGAVTTNDTTTTITSIKSLVGFWTNYYISALGNNSSSSPSGINEQELWNILSGGTGEHIIDEQFIPTLSDYAPANHTHTFASLTDKPTTIAQYGITDAYTKTETDSLFLSKAFFQKLFQAHNKIGDVNNDVNPSNPTADASATVNNIEAMFGFWTNSYISALGLNNGAVSLTLGALADVDTTGADDGQALIYDYASGKWAPGTVQGGVSGTTLADYGITDAYISYGQIVLGNSSITPIPISGSSAITGSLTPNSNNAYDLGTDGKRWRVIYTGDIYSKYYSFHDGGYLQEESSKLMWHKGNGSYTVIHSGNYSSYITDTDTTYKLTLNGTTNGTSSGTSLGSLYAPTGAGTNGYVLKSNGSGAPSWVAQSTLSVGSAATATTATKASKIIDSYNTSQEITVTYAKAGQSSTSWLASWNGYELGSISPSNITAGAATKDGAGNVITSKYVTLDTTQTISGAKTFSSTVRLNGCGIEDVSTAGLLMYHPAPNTWTGVSNTQWCVGAVDSQGVIRSNDNPLVHYKGGTNYNILDASGGALVGELSSSYAGNGTWLGGVSHAAFTCNYTGNYCAILNAPTKNGRISLSTYNGDNDNVYLGYISNSHISAGSPNNLDHSLIWNGANGSLGIGGALNPLANKTYDIGTTSLCWRYIYGLWVGSPGGEVFDIGANNQYHIRINTNGNVGIGTTSPSQRLHVDGNILATGGVTSLSDIRHKNVVSEVNTRIEDIANLPVFYFKWKNCRGDDNLHIGTSAQDVQKLLPELILGTEELSVNYGVLGTTIGILNSRKLTEHEREIMALKKENKALRKEINALKGRA